MGSCLHGRVDGLEPGLSFTNYDLATNTGEPVGLKNYQLIVEDPKVLTSLGNTFFYALLAVPLEIAIALGLALMLNTVRRGSGFFRTVFYLPKMTPTVATAAVFLLLLNGNTGAINNSSGCSASRAAVAGRPGLGQAVDRDHDHLDGRRLDGHPAGCASERPPGTV